MKRPDSSLFDVIVVGSGPSGATAAYQLASSGVSVAVLEREKLPRYKTCGGGLVYRTLKWLPFPISECVESECFRVQMRFLHTPLTFEVQRPVPIVSMTMRSTFDHFLSDRAVAAGARLFEDTYCRKVIPKDAWVELQTSRGDYRARFVVAADGVNSQVARSLGWTEAPHSAPALELELAVPDRTLQRHAGLAVFDFNPTDAGYGWVFPKRDHLSVGILSFRRGARHLRQSLQSYLETCGLCGLQPLHSSGHQIPIRPRSRFSRPRILLVGDAAGVAEPVTGEGISLAIRSGLLAASALLDRELRSPDAELQYQRQMMLDIGKELRWGRAVARVTYRWPKLRDFLFRRQGQQLCEVMTDIFLDDTRYRDLARQPSNYLKLLRRSR